jgi:hypothetical protein
VCNSTDHINSPFHLVVDLLKSVGSLIYQLYSVPNPVCPIAHAIGGRPGLLLNSGNRFVNFLRGNVGMVTN